MDYNPDKVRKLISEITRSLGSLDELASLSEHEFLSDPHKISSAKYNLIVAVEGAIDLCNHVISKNGFRTPEDYADTFRVMAEHGAFDATFADALIRMARFRNRLVHIYWDIGVADLRRILTTRLPDVRAFLDRFGEFIGLR